MNKTAYPFILTLVTVLLAGCASGLSPSDEALTADAQVTLDRFVERDPTLQDWVQHGYGYAVFPEIGKGGLIAGGAFGHGVVFEQGQRVGRTTFSQGTLGAQAGGQSYRMVIFFQDDAALRTFQRGNLEFSAQATAVAATAGTGATTSYDRGVAVFVLPRGGLMVEATIGGAKFTYRPL